MLEQLIGGLIVFSVILAITSARLAARLYALENDVDDLNIRTNDTFQAVENKFNEKKEQTK